MSMHTPSPQQAQAADRLLKTAESFLSRRNFTECRRYAIRAQESDPTHPVPSQLISIATVLSAPYIAPNVPDYYSVLSLPRFTSDHGRITSCFLTRFFQFDPVNNSHPFSSEALDMVLKARQVLLNDNERARFDEELRKSQGSATGVGGGGGTFWTMCPYCYHVYEYDIVFQGCCLRCQNVKCRKGFHAVAIPEPPPPEVVQKGKYLCSGFVPLMFTKDKNGNDGLNSEKIWVPFGETMVPEKDEGAPKGESDAENNEGESLDISSDDDIEIISPEAFKNCKKAQFQKEVKIEGDTMECTGGKFCANANGEKVTLGGETHNGNTENNKKEKRMRIKCVARSSKKLMGRGLRVDIEEAFKMMDDVEEEESDEEIEGDNEDWW